MKKMWAFCLISTILVMVLFGFSWAQESKVPVPGGETVAVLDKGTFVEVYDRGPGHHGVILYEVVKGKIRVVDAVSVNSDFSKDPPVVRYTRSRDIQEK